MSVSLAGSPRPGGFRAIALLSSGSAAGQLCALLAIPVLSRVYSPSAFGVVSIITAWTVVLGTAVTWRLEKAIPLPASDAGGLDVARCAMLAALVSSSVAGVVFVLFDPALARASGVAETRYWWWTVPLGALLLGWLAVLSQLAIRQANFRVLATRSFLQPATTAAMQVVLAHLTSGATGLLLGSLGGRTVGLPSLAAPLGGKWGTGLVRFRAPHRAILNRYWRFPVVGMPAGVLNVLGLQLPVVLVAGSYGAHSAGQFGMAIVITSLPIGLVANAIGQVFLSDFARALRANDSRLMALFLRSSRNLAVIAVIVVVIAVALSPLAFPFVLGDRWATSGLLAQALALSVGLRFLASPLAHVLPAMERQGWQLVLDLTRVLSTLAVFVVLPMRGASLTSVVWTYSVMMATLYAATWLVSYSAVRSSGNKGVT